MLAKRGGKGERVDGMWGNSEMMCTRWNVSPEVQGDCQMLAASG
jgi:hypothetical protein